MPFISGSLYVAFRAQLFARATARSARRDIAWEIAWSPRPGEDDNLGDSLRAGGISGFIM